MIAVNKGEVQIQDIHLRWTTAYSLGFLDEKLKHIDLTMSSGVVLRSQPSDFPHSSEISEESKQSTDELQNNDGDHLGDSAAQNDDAQDLAEDEEEDNDAISEELKSASKRTPKERYLAVQSMLSVLHDVGHQFMQTQEACDFFLSKLNAVIADCNTYMMEANDFSYENTPAGTVIDPLSIKSAQRSSARTESATEASKKRKSTFKVSVPVDDRDVEYEPLIKPKGRPKKAAEPVQ
jgi:hypothetical protein